MAVFVVILVSMWEWQFVLGKVLKITGAKLKSLLVVWLLIILVDTCEADDCDDNSKLKDPWHKLCPFITVLQDNLFKNWNIGQWNSIDEGKIAYHGCCCPVLTYDRTLEANKVGHESFYG